jgi:hypothetical protein
VGKLALLVREARTVSEPGWGHPHTHDYTYETRVIGSVTIRFCECGQRRTTIDFVLPRPRIYVDGFEIDAHPQPPVEGEGSS